MGCELEDLESVDTQVWLNQIHPEECNKIWEDFGKYLEKGENFQLEYRIMEANKNYIWVEEDVVCLKDENGNVNRVFGIIKDITERKLTEEKLKVSEEKYRSFIQKFDGIAFQLDENLFPEFMHGRVEEITGYSEKEFLSGQVLWLDLIHPDDKPLVIVDIERIQTSPYNLSRKLDFRILDKNGRKRWVHLRYHKFQEKDGGDDKYRGTIYDITERRIAEDTLKKIEAIRNKEIHHRIKNNLQVISSLLDLQAEKFNNRECIKDSEVLAAFKESQYRVMSIALIHEELHKSEERNTLNFSPYLERLVENLFRIYRIENVDVNLIMDVEKNIFFDMDTAVPLGMIVNELVSNSLKYAFPDRDKGIIQIKLSSKRTGHKLNDNRENVPGTSTRYTLAISDSGVGIPQEINFENPDTLGLQLVNVLVDQLDGEIELIKNRGTTFKIGFSVEPR
ncbi:PAS domain S-box-containing protein [Methanosarcina thermophila]|jgi:PAS domain S-box-containing protein|uniref:PAS domain S-box-containing protein n=4 Tax=Methanosarcina thermophila TaxID=2210 RepID=A0A1I7ACU3_METTE|nr:PAS domain-containing protein [Methanosarcina thermophila]GLI14250.1 hypothetical protein MTHERMMSTA1_13760 [Methanosarcina thermophila MST-A1]AKB12207.1 sensory transduction histidine kinase [Methanosarcina thermophila TM-1]AKB14590.1 sensory transduction histidine kinase [Methanosarcina thermophila CHTI-55]NLU57803.1 PAS domain-containing protein [Methanosarcina thermophila]SFT72767.1 PAS domain S-box-containing protein [Methanosarcina thermophila]